MMKTVFLTVILISAFCFQAYAQICSPAPVGLVSWWSGDNNSLDSRLRNNGTLQNGASYASGIVGNAFSFDGNDDRVFIPHNANLNVANVTLEAWVFPTAFGGQGSIINKRTAVNNAGYGLEPTAGGNLSFFIYIGGNLFFVTSPSPMLLNTWSHVAGTFDGSVLKILVNGTQVASQNISGSIDATTGDLVIGENNVNGTNWTGLIDEPTVYNRALSATEIQSIVNAGTSGKCKPTATVSPSGQVGWWSGDGNANDLAGTNNGTIQGNVTYSTGKTSQSFQLGGTGDLSGNGDRVNIGNPTNLQLQDFTIETWIKRSSSTIVTNSPFPGTAGGTFFAYGQNGYGFLIDQNTNRLALTNVGNSAVFSNLTVTDTNWHHVAVTKSGNQTIFYVDGVSDTQTYSTAFGFTTNAAIGARGDNNVQNAFFGAIDELSIYSRSLTTNEITSIYNAGIAGKLKDNTTATGANVAVNTKSDATVTFPTVSTAGITQQIPLDLSTLPSLPIGSTTTGLTSDIATTATFTGSPQVCFNLPSITNSTTFNNLRIAHLENNVWTNRTDLASINFATKTICTGGLTSLSPFAVVNGFAPTVASVAISGRVITANGSGIRGVNVSLTNSNGEVFRAVTGTFGYYRFENLPVGEIYILSISAKRYSFANRTRVINLNDELTDADFIAEGK